MSARAPLSAVRLLAALAALHVFPANSADRLSLAVEPDREPLQPVVRDIAKFVARPAGITLDLVSVANPAEGLRRLREDARAGMALISSDVVPALADAAASGGSEANRTLALLRVVVPLYQEDVYFVARKDYPADAVHEIKDARINVGPPRGNTALSASNIYRLMFGESIPDANISHLGHEEALVKLITDRSLDVVVFVAARPARLLANMKPEARRFVKLLKFDPQHAGHEKVEAIYGARALQAEHYPNLLQDEMTILTTRLYLAAFGNRRGDGELLARFARAWCRSLPRLHDEGHPALREIQPADSGLVSGWEYHNAVSRELARCAGKPYQPQHCTRTERVLGLCE